MATPLRSASAELLWSCARDLWARGERYADEGRVTVEKNLESEIEASVQGAITYPVRLRYGRKHLNAVCGCPSREYPCKHMIAAAIVWDESRGLARPDVSALPTGSERVSRAAIRAAYRRPLDVDTTLLRKFADSGSWTRPHSRLPIMPRFDVGSGMPLDLSEFRKACLEIRSWTRRKTYDPYFCAGEMVAAFVHVLRAVRARVPASDRNIAEKIYRLAKSFDHKLGHELIDDSEANRLFSGAQIEALAKDLGESRQRG